MANLLLATVNFKPCTRPHVLKERWCRDFPQGFETRVSGAPNVEKGVLDYDSGVFCFNEIKTTTKILIILAF